MFYFIPELSEVVNVTSGTPAPGAPKKSEDKCFFDVNTKASSYIYLEFGLKYMILRYRFEQLVEFTIFVPVTHLPHKDGLKKFKHAFKLKSPLVSDCIYLSQATNKKDSHRLITSIFTLPRRLVHPTCLHIHSTNKSDDNGSRRNTIRMKIFLLPETKSLKNY